MSYDILIKKDKYKQFFLKGNPFVKTSAEAMTEEEILETLVFTAEDEAIATNIEIVLSGGGATISLVGDYGTGKSVRAIAIAKTFRNHGGLVFLCKVPSGDPVRFANALFESVCTEALSLNLPVEEKDFIFEIREYYKNLTLKKLELDSHKAGRDLASVFSILSKNDYSTCFIIDEFEELISAGSESEIREAFTLTREYLSRVHGLKKHITVICSSPKSWQMVKDIHPAVISRIMAEIEFQDLDNDAAIELVSKRLKIYRDGDAPDPLFPFTREVVERANEVAYRNPRYLLVILRSTLEAALKREGSQKVELQDLDTGIRLARGKLSTSILKRMKEELTSREFDIFLKICEKFDGGPVFASQLAESLDIDQGNISRYLNKLAKMGYLDQKREGQKVLFEAKELYKIVFARKKAVNLEADTGKRNENE
ncbi:MAG: ArsR family transcriptional regulator [Candidatus Jordarchaeaceae archaeon]